MIDNERERTLHFFRKMIDEKKDHDRPNDNHYFANGIVLYCRHLLICVCAWKRAIFLHLPVGIAYCTAWYLPVLYIVDRTVRLYGKAH